MFKRNRRSMRIPGYDYSAPGAYFVTINVKYGYSFFGHIFHGKMHLSESGEIINKIWQEIPARYENAIIDEYVIMPNHFHGIIRMGGAHDTGGVTGNKNPMLNKASLSNMIRWFKGRSAYEIRKIQGYKEFAWHLRFYERIIRNERELARIRKYIINNPAKWEWYGRD